MKIIEFQCRLWVLPIDAITLYPFIFYKKSAYCRILRRHEWTHVRQVRERGWWSYYIHYFYSWAKLGYYHIDVEKEAYAEQDDGEEPWFYNRRKN